MADKRLNLRKARGDDPRPEPPKPEMPPQQGVGTNMANAAAALRRLNHTMVGRNDDRFYIDTRFALDASELVAAEMQSARRREQAETPSALQSVPARALREQERVRQQQGNADSTTRDTGVDVRVGRNHALHSYEFAVRLRTEHAMQYSYEYMQDRIGQWRRGDQLSDNLRADLANEITERMMTLVFDEVRQSLFERIGELLNRR